MAPSGEFRQSWKAGREAVQRHWLLLGLLGTVVTGVIEITRTLLNRHGIEIVVENGIVFFILGPLLVILFHKILPKDPMARDTRVPIYPED